MAKQASKYTPIFVAIGVVFGIFIGSFLANHLGGKRVSIINSSSSKISDMLHLIDDYYVDTVDMENLTERALPSILRELDPHSKYISAADVEASMQELNGSFSGIGVRFTIYDDTVCVVRVIEGGPSDKEGLKAGDRILAINGKPYIGKDVVSNDTTMKLLKGPKGTSVSLTLLRRGQKPFTKTIVRDDVPLPSVDAAYMLDKTAAYVRITTFGSTTYDEFMMAMDDLSAKGMKSLIIDLRGNLGGYMETAVSIANEFLENNKLIVYTQGRKSPREERRSNGKGRFQKMPFVVLVDETSASASEIMAGAFQDNDRAMIVGRRTFGKGLVQVPIEFADGSMLRLTKARYYTPSGRCLQKPYSPGDEEEYESDLLRRAESGEYFSQDSIKHSDEKYRTSIGRTVYGGGGITADIFIPKDTIGATEYLRDAILKGLINKFSFSFVDNNRSRLDNFKTETALENYLNSIDIVEQFAQYAAKNELPRKDDQLKKSAKLLKEYLLTNILIDQLDTQGAVEYLNRTDEFVLKALELIKTNKTYPEQETKALGKKAVAKVSHIAFPMVYAPRTLALHFVSAANRHWNNG